MQRVMIIGCCGAGKSTLARKLSAKTGLELIHLDQHYWNPNWVESPTADWEKTMKILVAKPSWIMDGNYGGTIDIRLKAADTIIFLDYSTMKCLWRVTKRTLQYWKRKRPDMVEGCYERFSWEFYRYVATFRAKKRKGLLDKLNAYQDQKQILIFKNDQATQQFLAELNSNL